MLWLILSIITAILYSISAFLDNFITDVIFTHKKPQAVKVFNGVTYIFFAFVIAMIFNLEEIPLLNIGLFLLSGVLASISSIPYYLALKNEETTGAAIFYQLQPIFYLLAGALFFSEPITLPQIIAFVLIMAAPIIIVLTRKHKKSRQLQMKTSWFFIIYVFLLASSGIISTHFADDVSFTTFFVYFLLGRGLSDVVLTLTHPDWREQFKEAIAKNPIKNVGIIGLNQIICVIADFTIRLALILGTSAIVSALSNSAELIIIFVLGIVLTKIWPKFGREHLHRHIIIAHLVGTVLCVIGILILELA